MKNKEACKQANKKGEIMNRKVNTALKVGALGLVVVINTGFTTVAASDGNAINIDTKDLPTIEKRYIISFEGLPFANYSLVAGDEIPNPGGVSAPEGQEFKGWSNEAGFKVGQKLEDIDVTTYVHFVPVFKDKDDVVIPPVTPPVIGEIVDTNIVVTNKATSKNIIIKQSELKDVVKLAELGIKEIKTTTIKTTPTIDGVAQPENATSETYTEERDVEVKLTSEIKNNLGVQNIKFTSRDGKEVFNFTINVVNNNHTLSLDRGLGMNIEIPAVILTNADAKGLGTVNSNGAITFDLNKLTSLQKVTGIDINGARTIKVVADPKLNDIVRGVAGVYIVTYGIDNSSINNKESFLIEGKIIVEEGIAIEPDIDIDQNGGVTEDQLENEDGNATINTEEVKEVIKGESQKTLTKTGYTLGLGVISSLMSGALILLQRRK